MLCELNTNNSDESIKSKKARTWAASPAEFATIVSVESGKQIADFASPHLSPEECAENMAIALAGPLMLASLQRAEFLMHRVSEGDHKSLEMLADCAAECRDAIDMAGGAIWDDIEP